MHTACHELPVSARARTADDATYVALAESEGATLVTRDGRTARAHGVPVNVTVV